MKLRSAVNLEELLRWVEAAQRDHPTATITHVEWIEESR